MRSEATTAPASARRSTTAEQILDIAEKLIQTRSYSAFSYQDISDALGITKASIHYHFASKAELGAAVVNRYAEHFAVALAALDGDQSKSTLEMLDFYVEPYVQFAKTPDRICLCGALAGEMMALPPEMRKQVKQFFESHSEWLAGILKRGAARNEFKLSVPPAVMAHLIFGALQGALLVKRTTGDTSQLKDVITAVKSQLLAPRRS